jgi:hypothetical protein
MDARSFLMVLILSIIFTVVVNIIYKKQGGIYSFVITTVLLVLGLNSYAKPGWVLKLFDLRISLSMFLVVVAILYIYSIKQMIESEKAFKFFFLSWLLPGLGHFIQKKYLKGIVFLAGVLLLLACGLVMEGKLYDTKQLHPLLILGFLGDLGNGLFYFFIKIIGLGKGNIEAVTYHYGTTYLVSAGLINYLIALNAFDIARGKRK